MRRILLIAALAVGAVVISACGGRGEKASRAADRPRAVAGLSAAQAPRASQFPSTRGRSLQQLASLASSTAQLGAATATFTPGRRRFAFALTGSSKRFLYAPTAIYLAPSPSAPAEGPFLAPADPMTVSPQYRSQENDGPLGLHAIYSTEVPARQPGVLDVLALTRVASRLIGATGEISVAASSPIPDVGQHPPPIATDTLATVHGKLRLLTTRLPPEQMHSVSLRRVLGRRPVALLFSTPQLCTSRVCGPVTDETVALSREFAGRIVFLHQEVYVDNQPAKGLRPQLKAFHLETEPWLFAINRRGVIAARLEGAFGIHELRRALASALR